VTMERRKTRRQRLLSLDVSSIVIHSLSKH